MAKYVIDETTLKKIANAIREATGETNEYTLTEMIAKTTALKDRILELEARSGPPRECVVWLYSGCEMWLRFQEGMTWRELVDSPMDAVASYCEMGGCGMYHKDELQLQVNNGYVVIPGTLCCEQGGGYILDSSALRVSESDVIIPDEPYTTEPYTAYIVDEDGNTYEIYFSPGDTFEELAVALTYTALCHCGADLWVGIDEESETVSIQECPDCGAPEMLIYDGPDLISIYDEIIEGHTYYAIPRDSLEEPDDGTDPPLIHVTLSIPNLGDIGLDVEEGMTVGDFVYSGYDRFDIVCPNCGEFYTLGFELEAGENLQISGLDGCEFCGLCASTPSVKRGSHYLTIEDVIYDGDCFETGEIYFEEPEEEYGTFGFDLIDSNGHGHYFEVEDWVEEWADVISTGNNPRFRCAEPDCGGAMMPDGSLFCEEDEEEPLLRLYGCEDCGTGGGIVYYDPNFETPVTVRDHPEPAHTYYVK